MEALKIIRDEIVVFFRVDDFLAVVHSGDYRSLLTLQGLQTVISPVIPLLLLIEIARALLYKRFKVLDYKVTFLTYVFNRSVSRFISLAAVAYCIGLFEPWAVFKSAFEWYWLIYAYVVWEFAHFVYHYLAHKVRLLWCLHSTHHAPESMNLSVDYAHFFLEAPYAEVVRTSICILLGVNPALLFFIMFVDGFWGAFIHVGENILKDGRLGFLSQIILTPSHHRVHHARNPMYIDTNFCNLLNVWDRVFGTFQPEREDAPVEYGINRPMNPGSFVDMYFGEIAALWRDVKNGPGPRNKLLYVVMPPGWSHTGESRTARVIRDEFRQRHPNK